jgi:subtilisin family serine protease
MDGKTAFITRGAEIGASRGMILVNAAGNEGNDPWKYMGAPADAPSVFTVGAVNSVGAIAPFSSFGPTADNRVKPDVLAQGQGVYIISHTSSLSYASNGTSFASPVMAGVVACFWQAFPNLTSTQIMQRIRESADRYSNPHEQYGYGIPNFETAYANVLNVDKQKFINDVSIFPNPVNTTFTLKMNTNNLNKLSISIFNILGKKVYEKKILKSKNINVSMLNTGIYILKVIMGNQQKTIKLVKR